MSKQLAQRSTQNATGSTKKGGPVSAESRWLNGRDLCRWEGVVLE